MLNVQHSHFINPLEQPIPIDKKCNLIQRVQPKSNKQRRTFHFHLAAGRNCEHWQDQATPSPTLLVACVMFALNAAAENTIIVILPALWPIDVISMLPVFALNGHKTCVTHTHCQYHTTPTLLPLIQSARTHN